ncbi:MAG: hypothetical protein ABJZ55_16030 [Fuerstiella sp.]
MLFHDRKRLNFNDKRLAKAIAIRDQSYGLLMWLSDALNADLIQPAFAARHSGGPEAAIQWLDSNHGEIPEHLRPRGSDLAEFGAFFSTYLLSSFEVVEQRGATRVGRARGICRCEICQRLTNAPFLRTRKVYARHKRRANMLMEDCLQVLAKKHHLNIDVSRINQLVANQQTRRDCAYLAYGYWLVQRLSGESDGTSVLALWRLIAWDPRGGMRRGGMRRGFSLKLEDFQSARERLLVVLRSML